MPTEKKDDNVCCVIVTTMPNYRYGQVHDMSSSCSSVQLLAEQTLIGQLGGNLAANIIKITVLVNVTEA